MKSVYNKSAFLSPDRMYRYELIRRWSYAPLNGTTFVMLNPSTADADDDDPTIRRCVSFAKDFGSPAMSVSNLYAYRSSKPADLLTADDPVGPDNNIWLKLVITHASLFGRNLVAAWGAKADQNRVDWFMDRAGKTPVKCLGKNKDGSPKHPLYVKTGTELVEFN